MVPLLEQSSLSTCMDVDKVKPLQHMVPGYGPTSGTGIL
jgi:hypothetical protein